MIHISHLKANADGSREFPLRPEYTAPPPPIIHGDEDGDDEDEYVAVEALRSHRWRGKSNQRQCSFLVKWVGHGEDENQWISERSLRTDMEDKLVDELKRDYVARTGQAVLRIEPLTTWSRLKFEYELE